jgi:YesN/AraC family two-component response regulator
MNNSYDEIKNLLKSSRNMLGEKNKMNETREHLVRVGLINEQSIGQGKVIDAKSDQPDNMGMSIETEIDMDTNQEPKDKQQAYRISGGILVMHGKKQIDLELTTEEKIAFQETMDEFVQEVSELVDFFPLNVYTNNVEWSGKVIDQDLEFFYSIGENSGVYINGDMIKLDENFMDFVQKLSSYYNKFKAKWSRVLASRKKTEPEA